MCVSMANGPVNYNGHLPLILFFVLYYRVKSCLDLITIYGGGLILHNNIVMSFTRFQLLFFV